MFCYENSKFYMHVVIREAMACLYDGLQGQSQSILILISTKRLAKYIFGASIFILLGPVVCYHVEHSITKVKMFQITLKFQSMFNTFYEFVYVVISGSLQDR